MPGVQTVVSVIGRDQKGVVARFATHLAERGANILDLEQQVVHGQFMMDMLVDLAQASVSLDELVTDMLELGKQLDMEVRVSLHDRARPKRVAVLVSKERHCLDQLIEDAAQPGYRGQLVCVLSNHPDLEPVAQRAGLPFAHHPAGKEDKAAHFAWLEGELAKHEPEVVVLARYMQIVPAGMVARYRDRIINIHPSLLPHFPGARPYHQAWESGVRVAGCTAHLVTEQLDQGPIILQDVFHIDVGHDSAEDVRSKGQRLEGRVLADAVAMHLDQKLTVVDGKVVFRPGLKKV